MNDEAVSLLMDLGFSAEQASEALRVSAGNADDAANYLFSAPPQGSSSDDYVDSTAPRRSSSGVQVVHGPISQYSLGDGRSACTCIALTAVDEFLKNHHGQLTNHESTAASKLDSEFLQNIVTSGVAKYQQLQSSAVGVTAVEHLSAEEVLGKGMFPSLRLLGEIRQGILSHDRKESQGLRRMLLDSRQPSSWSCCLIIKPPETVVVCLPPGSGAEIQPFILVDSHPRPQQFGASEAYARLHPTLEDLLNSLHAIFPCTDLGRDIAPLMAAMYNAFDLYVLVRRETS